MNLSNHPVPLSKEGSTAFPKPFSPQGTRDVAGDAIALPGGVSSAKLSPARGCR